MSSDGSDYRAREARRQSRYLPPQLPVPGSVDGHGAPVFVGESLRVPERLIRLSIAGMVPTFGAIATVMHFSGEGPECTASRVVAIIVIGSTLPAGLVLARAPLAPMWWGHRSRLWSVNHLFVLYGDIGVGIVLFTFGDPEAALFGSLLLAVLSAYAAHFCAPAVRNVHIAVAAAVIAALAALTLRTGEYSVAAVLGRFLVALVVVNGTVLLQSLFAARVRHAIRQATAEAHQDPLTRLWNRRGFTHWATATVRSSRGPVGVLFVDIDNYKAINDTHGHDVGDQVLELAARRLTEAVGVRGVLARTGGDEFAVAVSSDPENLLRLAESIRTGIHRPGDRVPVTTSIGAAACRPDALGDSHGADEIVSVMLRAADTALYAAKAAGRNQVAGVDLDVPDPEVAVRRRPQAPRSR